MLCLERFILSSEAFITDCALKTVLLQSSIFFGGVILPFGITCLLLWRSGVFDRFWFWTVDYARHYASLVSLSQASQLFFYSTREVIVVSWPIWMLAGFGLGARFMGATNTS